MTNTSSAAGTGLPANDDDDYRCMLALENAIVAARLATDLSSMAASLASDGRISEEVAAYAAEHAAETAIAVEKAFYYLPTYRSEGAPQ